MENDWDYECITCGHRIKSENRPRECEKCEGIYCFLSKETIEENERINAEESK